MEHQETINVEIENISSFKKKHFGDQYMKLFEIHILKKQDYFQQHFKTNVEIILIKFRTYQIKSKQILKMAM